ncbi:hypothetical protein CJ030_MR8G010111 [Morella rubra]|uniref:Uncharacterized protein n=1 Tax=Morella rubra TaxID=262757 RepID=A0A6A1UR59_9ROSI|nr:hypothetical protein CJ030_MR8G010111 [Morella rubra]
MSSNVDQPQHPNIATSSDGEPVTSVPTWQDPLLIVTSTNPPYRILFTHDTHLVRSILSLDPRQDPSIVHTTQLPQDPVVASITEIFDNNDPDIDFPVCVFKVPNSLSATKPEAYCPQVVGLGPLHHNRSELATMQMYKISVARKIHRGFGRRDGFKTLIKGISLKLMPSVRACYQMYLMDNDSQVACIMAIDVGYSGKAPMEDVPGQEEEAYEYPAGMVQKSLESAALDVILNLAIPHQVKQPLQLVKGIRELPWSNLYSSFQNKAPVKEEILIPTASNLCDVGVKFSSSDRITGIVFDPVTASFKLPIVKLNNNSEVVIRNLVAYEAMYKPESEPLVFTGYIEMMSGIIQTAEDVKVLRDHQVLDIEFLKDDEVVKIFTGMSKPMRSANAPNIDKAITDVNNFYNGTTKGKARKFIKKWGSILWRNRKIVAAILLLSLMALETFCSVYGCPRIFEKTT